MAIPTLIQRTSTSSTRNVTVAPGDEWRIRLPDPANAGNCLVLGFQSGNVGAPTFSVSDDKGNTWTQGAFKLDTTNNQQIYLFYALNVADGTRVVSVTNNGSFGNGYISGVVAEFTNVATSSAADGNNGNFAVNATITGGSITPSTSGDLFLQYVVRSSTPGTSSFTAGTSGANPNTTWALVSADLCDGHAMQWTVYSSTAAINPTMTMGDSSDFISVALALKTAQAGTPADSGLRVAGIHHLSQPRNIANPFTAQVPCVGNLLIAAFSSGLANFAIASISDSAGNSWQSTGAANSSGTLDTSQIWYAVNNGPSATYTVTVTYNGVINSDATILWYDVIGADPGAPFDQRSVSNGRQLTWNAMTEPPAFSPSSPGGIVIFEFQMEFNSITGISIGLFDVNDFDNEQLTAACNNDQNGGWAHYYNPDTSSIGPPTWSWQNNTDAQEEWTAYAAAFKGAALPPLSAWVGEPRYGRGILSA